MLSEAGFVNELITIQNKYRACQCVMTHVVFKTRKEEIDQLRIGMESISLLSFLKSSEECLSYIFPLVRDLKITAEEFINIIPPSSSFDQGDGGETINWFVQYVKDVQENKRGNVQVFTILKLK